MGFPTSDVSYTSAKTERDDNEAHKGQVVVLEKKKTFQCPIRNVILREKVPVSKYWMYFKVCTV
jgi:hypothetical protein